jgi:hypothetical protein
VNGRRFLPRIWSLSLHLPDRLPHRPNTRASTFRSPLTALAIALVFAVGAALPGTLALPGISNVVPARAATTSNAKVVIIVGATHGSTSKYRGYANEAYKEAIRYTSNVKKVYSPNATWSAVKSATKGASIVIYFGHGNGWPSPYTYDPEYKTKDGFGLNSSAGNGDYNNKYYGEPYVSTLDLADNAIILLHHLCYAAGNSEPGHAEPSVTTAKKRIDNYGAGFLRTKARAVLADGHAGPVAYLRAIFTTNQTIESLWRTAPSANGNVKTFAGTRSAGATAFMDPKTSTSGFYRSLIGDPSLTTMEITGGFSVPGRAAPKSAGAPIYDDVPSSTEAAGLPQPAEVLPAGTRLKILDKVGGSGADTIFRVEGLDDPSIDGYAIARDLEPRDSVAPEIVSVSGGGGGMFTTVSGNHKLSGKLNEASSWTVKIKQGSTTYVTKNGSGTAFDASIDPTAAAGDGQYSYSVSATDDWLNGPTTATGTFTIDTTPPSGNATIDGGAASAVVGTVRVDLAATDGLSGLSKVRLSNTPDVDAGGVLTDGTTFASSSQQAWTLAVGTGTRKVHVQWRDKAGNWSGVATDTINVAPPDTTFEAITPVRLLDTRAANPSGVTKLTASQPLTFKVAGRGGIPADAIAVAGNLTVTGQTAPGYVALGPVVGSSPNTSTINFPKGDNRANGVIVPLDRTGRLEATYKAASGSTTHLVFDATGYFVAGTSGDRYNPLAPGRFLDTRVVADSTGGAPISDAQPLAIDVGGRTVGSTAVPEDAVAITGNLTVTGQTEAGYLALTPTPQTAPATSTLNFPTGDTRANNVTVPLGSDGRVWLVYRGSGTAHAALDVTGYFKSGSGGLTWVPLAPARILDSRENLGKTGAFVSADPDPVTVQGRGGVHGGGLALTGNLTVTQQTVAGYSSVTPTPVAAPSTSTINFPKGDNRANGVVAKIDPATGKVSLVYRAASGATVHMLLDVTGYFHD